MSSKKIELRPIRRRVEQTIRKLRRVEQTGDVRKALRGLKRCLGEIRMICGPSMVIPIP